MGGGGGLVTAVFIHILESYYICVSLSYTPERTEYARVLTDIVSFSTYSTRIHTKYTTVYIYMLYILRPIPKAVYGIGDNK